MKLIVTGATGLIGSEIVRQGLQLKSVTSVVAVSRTPIDVHEGIDSSKLKNVFVKDYGDYLEHVKAEFAGAGACIWCVRREISADIIKLVESLLTPSVGRLV
jgi:uncharacterized protein YbjT (DUF2867 family)